MSNIKKYTDAFKEMIVALYKSTMTFAAPIMEYRIVNSTVNCYFKVLKKIKKKELA